ncbi:hypothetical protein Nans01_34090 [Nocardiopsis ansamitocini]|uniref:Uncharacterized protein n=1 Tax=Nocardiopsis ansamitocini TaxID=1670832 RepID=A0A9W6P8R5_9ACTN|nr:hypothetical protein Nans01_34090 [Nocardiopsis ansamitocini]
MLDQIGDPVSGAALGDREKEGSVSGSPEDGVAATPPEEKDPVS